MPLNAALPFEPDPANGSNNWAVAGSKTRSGYPILCSDPHLGLRLPSIWYEMQLVSPNVNTYGVTLPGTPDHHHRL
ncbi:MAG: penicillin acylase family protein [Calditrichae bacterium]|nr:penicillin acylase family protein [Calditrichia bacterium]